MIKKIWSSIFLFFLSCGLVSVLVNLWFLYSSIGYMQKLGSVEETRPFALVLGAAVFGNELSGMLQCRVDATVALYRSGLVSKILVSGDGEGLYYNETRAMKKYLRLRGVQDSDITVDEQGVNTFTSLYRAKHKFALQTLFVISQSFHLPRAISIARLLGIDAIGIPCDSQIQSDRLAFAANSAREWLARPQDFFKVLILQ